MKYETIMEHLKTYYANLGVHKSQVNYMNNYMRMLWRKRNGIQVSLNFLYRHLFTFASFRDAHNQSPLCLSSPFFVAAIWINNGTATNTQDRFNDFHLREAHKGFVHFLPDRTRFYTSVVSSCWTSHVFPRRLYSTWRWRRFLYVLHTQGRCKFHVTLLAYTFYYSISSCLLQVQILTDGQNVNETVHEVLHKEEVFGIVQGLFKEIPHHFSFRALTIADIASLKLSEWEYLLDFFPSTKDIIYQRVEEIYYTI